MRVWVRSLALLSGLRILLCCELWCRLQMQLGSCITPIRPLAWEPLGVALKRQTRTHTHTHTYTYYMCYVKHILSGFASWTQVTFLSGLYFPCVENGVITPWFASPAGGWYSLEKGACSVKDWAQCTGSGGQGRWRGARRLLLSGLS